MADAALVGSSISPKSCCEPVPAARPRLGRQRGRARPARPSSSSATAAPCAGCCGSRANWAWPAPGWPATSTSRATSTPRSTCSPACSGSAASRRRGPSRQAAARPARCGAVARGLRRRSAWPGPLPPAAAAARRSAGAPASRTPGAATGAPSATTTTWATTSTRWSSARPWSTPAPTGQDGGATLEEAQRAKLDLVCRKLGLQRGRCGCSTSAAAGARWRSTPPASTASASSASPSPSEQAALRPQARRRGGPGRPGRDPGAGLPGRRRRPVRRDLLHRHGRARRHASSYRSTPTTCTPCWARRPAAQPPDRPPPGADESAYRHRRLHRRATSSPTASSPRSARPSPCWRRPASRSATSSRCASTTPSPCARWVANLERHWDEAVRRDLARAGPGSGGSTWPPRRVAFERNRIGVNQVLAVRTPERATSGHAAARPRPGRLGPTARRRGPGRPGARAPPPCPPCATRS